MRTCLAFMIYLVLCENGCKSTEPIDFYETRHEESDKYFDELLALKSRRSEDEISPMQIIDKLDRLDTYLSLIAKKTGREYMFLSVYQGVITTINDESVINRKDQKITCSGPKSVLELNRGKRKCIGGRFIHDKYDWNSTCGAHVARSSIYYNGVLMHCVGSRKVDVVAGKLNCPGKVFTDEEINVRCPISGDLPVSPSVWLGYDGGVSGLNQWGTLGKYNLGHVGCDSGLTVSFQQDGKRYYCLGEGVYVADFEDGSRYKCNDRQISSADYLHMCGNNGNMPNELDRPVFVNIDASVDCPGKLIAVRSFDSNNIIAYCIGHTTLVTFNAPDTIFCHGGLPLSPNDIQKRCASVTPQETVYLKMK